jgi:mannitol-1-phosphate/altronate dehydrogenase
VAGRPWKVEVNGYSRLRRLLRDEAELYGPAWRDAMEQIGEIAADRARDVAPKGATGNLRAAVGHKVQAKAVPLYAMVVANRPSTTGRKKVNVAKILEFSPKHGHQGWMRNAVKSVWGQVDRALEAAANAIERHFGRYG